MEPLTRKSVKAGITKTKIQALELLAVLANSQGTDEEMNALQNLVIRPTNPGALLRFCHEIRTVWKDLDRSHTGATRKMRLSAAARRVLHYWCEVHPLNDPQFWRVDWENRTFFPTDHNWRPYFAFVLFEYQHLAGICKSCGRYFRKRRTDATYCYHPDCQRYNTLQRVKKSHKKHGRRRSA